MNPGLLTFGLCSSSNILKENNVSETGFISIFRLKGEEVPTQFGLLDEANPSH